MSEQAVRLCDFSIIYITTSLLLSIVSAEMEFRSMDHRDHMDQFEQLPQNDDNEQFEQNKHARQTHEMLSQALAEVSPHFESLCNHLSRGLYYSPDLLIDTEWTSVYAWNKESGYKCTQAEFEIPTEGVGLILSVFLMDFEKTWSCLIHLYTYLCFYVCS